MIRDIINSYYIKYYTLTLKVNERECLQLFCVYFDSFLSYKAPLINKICWESIMF